jgi:hypothetical protein
MQKASSWAFCMINQQEMIQSANTFIVPNTALDYWRREDPVGKKKL